jgi:hypothetical protein
MSELEPSPELPDKTPTREVHLPKRIRNALFAAGLKTVGEVRKMPHEALRWLSGIWKSLNCSFSRDIGTTVNRWGEAAAQRQFGQSGHAPSCACRTGL